MEEWRFLCFFRYFSYFNLFYIKFYRQHSISLLQLLQYGIIILWIVGNILRSRTMSLLDIFRVWWVFKGAFETKVGSITIRNFDLIQAFVALICWLFLSVRCFTAITNKTTCDLRSLCKYTERFRWTKNPMTLLFCIYFTILFPLTFSKLPFTTNVHPKWQNNFFFHFFHHNSYAYRCFTSLLLKISTLQIVHSDLVRKKTRKNGLAPLFPVIFINNVVFKKVNSLNDLIFTNCKEYF